MNFAWDQGDHAQRLNKRDFADCGDHQSPAENFRFRLVRQTHPTGQHQQDHRGSERGEDGTKLDRDWTSHGPCYVVGDAVDNGFNRGATARTQPMGHSWNQVLSNVFGPDVIPASQQRLRPCHCGDGKGTAG